MDGTGSQLWTLLAVVAALGVLAVLHYAATAVMQGADLHRLRQDMLRLRKEHEERRKMGINPNIPEVGEVGVRKRKAA